jgi:hypothetical protein
MMRRTAFLLPIALIFSVLALLLGNALPARALSAPAGAGLPAAALLRASPLEGGGIDLSALQPWADQLQLLLQPMAAGLPIALLVWLTVSALVWADLIKDDADAGKKKRRWALGSGIVFGIYASLAALSANALPAYMLPLILAVLDGIIRGIAAGIVAAFAYEAGSALLSRKP